MLKLKLQSFGDLIRRKLTQEIDIITNKLPELINEFNNVAGYINIEKSVAVEYTNNFKMTKLPK